MLTSEQLIFTFPILSSQSPPRILSSGERLDQQVHFQQQPAVYPRGLVASELNGKKKHCLSQ